MIRLAKFEDIPRCLEILEAAHKRTIYAQLGSVNREKARGIITTMAVRMTSAGSERTFFMVAQKAGVVQGFLCALLNPIYQIGSRDQATDLYTIVDESKADPADFLKLISAYKSWAMKQPSVLEVEAAVTDIMGKQAWQRLLPVYEQLGFEQSGVIFKWRPQTSGGG